METHCELLLRHIQEERDLKEKVGAWRVVGLPVRAPASAAGKLLILNRMPRHAPLGHRTCARTCRQKVVVSALDPQYSVPGSHSANVPYGCRVRPEW